MCIANMIKVGEEKISVRSLFYSANMDLFAHRQRAIL